MSEIKREIPPGSYKRARGIIKLPEGETAVSMQRRIRGHEADERIVELESERDELIGALSKMVLQYLSGQDGLLNHMFMSAGEDALEVLEKFGVVREAKGRGEFYEWVEHD